MDYSVLEGGLARMLDRLLTEGTATKNREADAFLYQNPNAILLGLLYDQRVLAEVAFTGPYKLWQRLGHLDPKRIAALDREQLQTVFVEKPAVHRFTNKMVDLTQAVCSILATEYENDAAMLWKDATHYDTVRKRIRKLPGFGEDKAEKMRFALHYFAKISLPDD